jgi:hypothetical protein
MTLSVKMNEEMPEERRMNILLPRRMKVSFPVTEGHNPTSEA